MSDIGIGLLLFACLLIAVGLIRFFSWLTELQEKHGSLGRAGANTIKRYVTVRQRDMSNAGDGSPAARASFDDGSGPVSWPVPAQQNQEYANQNATVDDIISLTYTSPVTDQQALTILALMRRENGEYFVSANKIRDIVGGADATVKAEVAALRPHKPTKPPARSVTRPPGGWPKSA
mgnify:CR=1 FL=1